MVSRILQQMVVKTRARSFQAVRTAICCRILELLWYLEFYNYRSLTAICCRNLDNFCFLEFYNFLSLNSADTVFRPQKLQSVVEF